MSCHWSSRDVLWCRANGLPVLAPWMKTQDATHPLDYITLVLWGQHLLGTVAITYCSWYTQMVPMSPHMCIQMVFSWVPFLPWSSHVIQVASTFFFMTYVCSVERWHSAFIPKLGPLNLTESLGVHGSCRALTPELSLVLTQALLMDNWPFLCLSFQNQLPLFLAPLSHVLLTWYGLI